MCKAEDAGTPVWNQPKIITLFPSKSYRPKKYILKQCIRKQFTALGKHRPGNKSKKNLITCSKPVAHLAK